MATNVFKILQEDERKLRVFKARAVAERKSRASGEKPPSFLAPLITSIVATDGGNGTFTRATTAYVADFEGLLKQALSGEARFQGARRVQNLILGSSVDLTNASWTLDSGGTGVNPTITANFGIAPDGTRTASRFQADRGAGVGAYSRVFNNYNVNSRPTIWLKSNDASNYNVVIDPSDTMVTVTPTWQRFAGASNNSYIQLMLKQAVGTSQTCDILAWGAQGESYAGQSNQNPSEYVSVGVLSAPYHGANVDGVKYFNYKNGNTVASNVVTEALGAAIGASDSYADASGPYGYLVEGARTNLCLQSQTLDNASWTIEQATISADAVAAPDGTTTADKIAEDNNNNFHRARQTGLATFNGVVAVSAYFKAAERTIAYINASNSGVADHYAYFTLTGSGSVSNLSAGTTGSIEALPNGWYRCTAFATLGGAGTMDIQVAPTTAAGTASYVGTTDSGVYVWGVQYEQASLASTYIPTTGSSATRNADVLTYALSGNIDTTAGTAYAEVTSIWTGTSTARHDIISSASGTPLYVEASAGKLSLNDGAARLGNVFTGATTIQKVTSKWAGASGNTYIAGTASANLTFDGDLSMTTALHIGDNNGGTQWDGTIRNARIYDYALSDDSVLRIPTIA